VPLLSSRALGAGVEVAEGAAAHGGRLAMESAGHTGTTFGDHEVFSCGYPPGCLGQAVCFQRVGGGACRKHLFFRNLEAKFLKTENLRGAVREAEPKRDAAAGLRTGK